MPSNDGQAKKLTKFISKSVCKPLRGCPQPAAAFGKAKKHKKFRVCGTPFGHDGLYCTKSLNHLGLCFGERTVL